MSGGTPAAERPGIAVVGAGYWGPNLVRNFMASPDWDLRWLVDLDTERARKVAAGAWMTSPMIALWSRKRTIQGRADRRRSGASAPDTFA